MVIRFGHSSGNVFADPSLDDAEALYTRATLVSEVTKIFKACGCTQNLADVIDSAEQVF